MCLSRLAALWLIAVCLPIIIHARGRAAGQGAQASPGYRFQRGGSRSLCGHIDKDPKGVPEWDDGPYYPDGAVTGKVTDSALVANIALIAHVSHPCGEDFIEAPFLGAYPEYGYLKPILKDMPSGPWTRF